jgi:hypothetical protein
VISSDSNSKYAQESACSAALLSAGTLNAVLGGKLRTRRERRPRKSAKYPDEYSSSIIDSLEETQAKKMAAKEEDSPVLELLGAVLCPIGISARAMELNSSCVSSTWSSIRIRAT